MSGEMWLTLAGLAVTVVVNIVVVTWTLANSRQTLLEKMRQDRDADVRAIGETIAALRQKINDVELEGFKTFVRRDSFYEITGKMEKAWDARIEKIEMKLDRIFESRNEPKRRET